MHPPGCALCAHPNANTNEKIQWKKSVTGRNVVRLKEPGATLDIQQIISGGNFSIETRLHNVNTTLITTATSMDEDQRPPCCSHTNGGISEYLIPGTIRLRNNASVIHVLIDTGCLQTNIIYARFALSDLLNADVGTLYKTDIILTTGVRGRSYGVQDIMNLTITLTNNDYNQTQRHKFLRTIVCRDVINYRDSFHTLINIHSFKVWYVSLSLGLN